MKKKLFILPILIFCLAINNVYAEGEPEVVMNCNPTNIAPGNAVTCAIGINNLGTKSITALTGTVNFDSNVVSGFEVGDHLSGSGITATKSGDNTLNVTFTGTQPENILTVTQLNFTINSNASDGTITLGINPITLTLDGTSTSVNGASQQVTIAKPSINYGLSSLTVSNGVFSPSFDTNKDSYIVTIPESQNTFSVGYTPIDSKTTTSIYTLDDYNNGKTQTLNANYIAYLPKGEGMTIVIENTSAGGTNPAKYTLTIKKEVTTSYDNTLKSLSVGGKRIDIVKGINEYVVELDSLEGYDVTSTLSDPTNFIFDSENNGNGKYSGESFVIRILPKDASTGAKENIYIIDVRVGSGGAQPNVNTNPTTGSISAFIVAIILIASLVVSIALYKRSIKEYLN